ncbi:MAG: ribonuclease HII [Cyanobacteria bacterium SIG28]|nr:ribonuclease HII [Cyanobacteria bacterium SIG28]
MLVINTVAHPLFEFDKNYSKTIIGTDEAGRGPGAGGVFAAAVHFDVITEGLISDLMILNDSKKLTPKKRNSIFDTIKNNTINEIVCIEVDEIEKINILNASLKAMNISCSTVASKLNQENILTLVDGNKLIKDYKFPQEFVIKGDSKSASIAAASILAKVSRDRYMEKLHEEFPMYNWQKNAGYLTAEHLNAIDKFGLTKYHRPSFLKKHFADK